MKSFFEKVSPSLFVALIVAIIGIVISTVKDNSGNKKRYIDSYEKVDFTGLDSNELKKNNFQILYNDNAVYSFTTINVRLYNFSDKDCENIKVLIEIKPQEGDSLQLVEPDVYGPHVNKAGVVKISDDSVNALNGNIRLEYLIETANRADSVKDVMFIANYGIISGSKPSIEVSIRGKGIEKRKYSRIHYEPPSWWESDVAQLLFIIVGYIILIVIIIQTLSYFNAKRSKRWRQYLIKNLNDMIYDGKLNFEPESIANSYREISDRFDYEDASRMMRWLKRLKPPSENI